ncbi:amino acid adenylation domain-containing protein [Chitinophaga sp. CF118]|nr:amino acid adenylation domain-containing protein [Chitinophaga sp. CF118]
MEAINTTVNNIDVIDTLHKALNKLLLKENIQFIKCDIATLDFSHDESPNKTGLQWIYSDMKQYFDITKNLLKIRIIHCSENDNLLYIKAHNLIFDNYSIHLFFNNTVSLYTATLRNKIQNINDKTYSYEYFIEYEQEYKKSEDFINDKIFWTNRIKDIQPTRAFESCMNHATARSLNSRRKELIISRELYHQVEYFCQQYNCTVFHYFIGVFFILNNCYGNEAPLIGLPINRQQEWFKNIIGPCINTLIFSIKISKNLSFTDIIILIKSELEECYNHHRFNLYDLLKELDVVDHIHNLVFAYQDETNIIEGNNQFSSINYLHSGEQQEDLVFHLFSLSEKEDYILSVNYCEDLFTSEIIDTLLRHFKHILEFLLSHPSQPIITIPYLLKDEQQQLLVTFNDNYLPLPNDKTIIDLFEEQVVSNPAAIALLFQDRSFTYLQINEVANQMAAYLRQEYLIQPGLIVAICLQRSEWIVIIMLAVLKTGAAYLPIDPLNPPARKNHMLQDSDCSLVIDGHILDTFKEVQRYYSIINIPRCFTQQNTAYIVYTSGSTGTPKGIAISHRNVFSFIWWCKHYFIEIPFDTLFSSTSACFDLFIFEIFYPISSGKQVRLLEWAMSIPYYLSKATKVMLNTVPSVVGSLLRDRVDLSNVSVLNIAGEAMPPLFLKYLDPNLMEINNLYGPSEDTTYSTVYKIKTDGKVLIGKPIANTQVYILNEQQQLVPIGVTGEICLSGEGLATGYIKNPALTAEKFVSNPFRPQERMYKTGDLGKWMPDGNIAFIGRKDEQIKITGYRIEPGEIASCLMQYQYVTNAVVTAMTNSDGRKELVAYVVSPDELDAAVLQNYLATLLPPYMVPAHYVQLHEIPLSSNGKINKKLLPPLNIG